MPNLSHYFFIESLPSVRFAMIYVDEAHPVEQNDFPPETGLPQLHLPRTIEQRMENAAVLAGKTSVPVYVDTLDNVGESLYGAHPERLYILHGGRVAMKGGEGPLNYKVTKRLVEGILESCLPLSTCTAATNRKQFTTPLLQLILSP